MKRAVSILLLAGLISAGAALDARAQTVVVGPSDAPRELDAAALAGLSREVTVNPDGSTTYHDVTVDGESWRVVIPDLTVGSGRGVAPAAVVRNFFSLQNFQPFAQTFTVSVFLPISMTGEIGAGLSASLAHTDANADGTGSLTAVAGELPVELLVDGNGTGVGVLEDLSLVTAFGGQTQTTDGSIGLPGNGAAIPTPASSFGLRARIVVSAFDTVACVAVAVAGEIGALSFPASPSGEAARDGAGELPSREIEVDLTPDPSPRGGAADPIKVVHGDFAVQNQTAITQSYTIVFTLPTTPLGGSTVMGGSVGVMLADGNLDGTATVSAPPVEPIYSGLADGVAAGFTLLDGFSMSVTQAGETLSVADSLGLPGPSIAPAPTIASSIGLRYRFTLTPFDAAAITGVFIIGTPTCPLTADSCDASFAKGALKIAAKEGKEKLAAKLSRGPARTQSELGNPLSPGGTTYDLCIYDDSSQLVGTVHVDRAGDDCGGEPCWKPVGDPPPDGKGYVYVDETTVAGGAKSIKLTGGARSKAKVLAKNSGKKNQLHLQADIAARLAGSTSATVQLRGSDLPGCIGVTLDEVIKNDLKGFRAKR
jgi:hypothetical protein